MVPGDVDTGFAEGLLNSYSMSMGKSVDELLEMLGVDSIEELEGMSQLEMIQKLNEALLGVQ